jgi:hypothetical protein
MYDGKGMMRAPSDPAQDEMNQDPMNQLWLPQV